MIRGGCCFSVANDLDTFFSDEDVLKNVVEDTLNTLALVQRANLLVESDTPE